MNNQIKYLLLTSLFLSIENNTYASQASTQATAEKLNDQLMTAIVAYCEPTHVKMPGSPSDRTTIIKWFEEKKYFNQDTSQILARLAREQNVFDEHVFTFIKQNLQEQMQRTLDLAPGAPVTASRDDDVSSVNTSASFQDANSEVQRLLDRNEELTAENARINNFLEQLKDKLGVRAGILGKIDIMQQEYTQARDRLALLEGAQPSAATAGGGDARLMPQIEDLQRRIRELESEHHEAVRLALEEDERPVTSSPAAALGHSPARIRDISKHLATLRLEADDAHSSKTPRTNNLATMVTHFRGRLLRAETKRKDTLECANALELQAVKVTNELARIQHELDAEKKAKEEADRKVADAAKAVRQKEEVLTQLQDEAQRLQRQVDDAIQEKTTAIREKKQAEAHNTAAEEDARQKIAAAEAKLGRIVIQKDDALKDKGRLQALVDDLQGKLDQLQQGGNAELDRIRGELRQAQQERDARAPITPIDLQALRQQVADLRQRPDITQQALDDLQTELQQTTAARDRGKQTGLALADHLKRIVPFSQAEFPQLGQMVDAYLAQANTERRLSNDAARLQLEIDALQTRAQDDLRQLQIRLDRAEQEKTDAENALALRPDAAAIEQLRDDLAARVADLHQAQQDLAARPAITLAQHQQLVDDLAARVADLQQAQQDLAARPAITLAQHQQLVDDLAARVADLQQAQQTLANEQAGNPGTRHAATRDALTQERDNERNAAPGTQHAATEALRAGLAQQLAAQLLVLQQAQQDLADEQAGNPGTQHAATRDALTQQLIDEQNAAPGTQHAATRDALGLANAEIVRLQGVELALQAQLAAAVAPVYHAPVIQQGLIPKGKRN